MKNLYIHNQALFGMYYGQTSGVIGPDYANISLIILSKEISIALQNVVTI